MMMQWKITVIFITVHVFLSVIFTDSSVKGMRFPVKDSGSDFIPAEVPTNLTAVASAYNVSSRLLQLNISWIPNKEGHQAINYNLHVWPLNQSDTYCNSEPYYAFIEDTNCSSWVVSPKPMAEAIHEFNTLPVVPGCSYRIKLEANPHNGQTYTEINYRVPDCVEGICSCRHAETLPKPELRIYDITQHTVNITWSLTDLHNVSSFMLRVGPKLLDGVHSAVYNLSWSRMVPASEASLYHYSYLVQEVGKYAATVRVVDNGECLGPEEQLVFHIENRSNGTQDIFPQRKIFLLVLLPTGSLLIFCCLLALLGQNCFYWFENLKQNTWIIRHGFFYKSVRMKSERVFRRNTSLQEWNVLYVEKEIEDARARGEVDRFEISYNRLIFQREIGHGAFGQVFLARAEAIRGMPGSRLVAVKKLKAKADAGEKEDFLEEISVLKRVSQHPNIVSLLACCTMNSDLCMVMEFVPCGDLLKYLHNLRQKVDERKPPVTSITDGMSSTSSTVMSSVYSQSNSMPCHTEDYLDDELDHRELHKFALQIARGMAHLESKSITHRDLAARNILIDNNKILKISDFGLSRTGVYVNTRRRKVPLRWLSIEAMRDSLYSSKSDVWAFAIVLWEIGTLGGFPYPTVADYDLLDYLKKGERLEKPDIVTQNLYSVMLVCWSESLDDRPSFAELVSYLEPSSDRHVYVDFSTQHNLPPMSSYVTITNYPSSGK